MHINRPVQQPPVTATDSFRTASDASLASSSVRSVSSDQQREINAIADYLTDHVFAAHKLPPADSADGQAAVDVHNAQITALIETRASRLHFEGETPATIADTFAKAEKLDRLATTASGALRAAPFAMASLLQYMQPAINKGDWLPAPLKPLTPLISGALSGAMDWCDPRRLDNYPPTLPWRPAFCIPQDSGR
ncbi:type III effector [Pseudomonas syringae pv. avii]|uniref:Type III effector n=1 Tax=Pseudomonas syringae pv. avii TaxID=663959 RepID=A0ABY1U319_PSESX|nr:type III effector [Pseudomonas syringae pv. avii]